MVPVPKILLKVIVTPEIPVPVFVAARPEALKPVDEAVPVKFSTELAMLKLR